MQAIFSDAYLKEWQGRGRKYKELQPKSTEETSGNLDFKMQKIELFEGRKRTGGTKEMLAKVE